MPVRCQDCNHHFLLDGTTVSQGISCPGCGSVQIERDQPSPTHSDGDLRNMVDPATQLDQGGNPLQEGIWANVDGGWQPSYKRDEVLSSIQLGPPMHDHYSRALPQEPYLPWWHQAEVKRFDGDQQLPITSTSAEFELRKKAIAPLVLMGGRILLGQAIGGLMRRAIHGQGNYMQQPQPEEYSSRPVGLVASEHTAVGHDAPVETPDSTPDLVEDHDPEALDQSEFNDKSDSSNLENPLIDGQAGGSQNPAGGEDQTAQKLEFRHDGDAVQQAELLLPLLLEFINSEKSGLDHPQIKALHEALDAEVPGYLDHADENDESVQKLLDGLRNPEGVHAKVAAPVYMNTPMAPGQMQMGQQQQQMPMPGTFTNPVQPGGMSVQGRCQNCGGVTNADGSCPQCGASAAANQGQPNPNQQQTPLGIMPSQYGHTAADHQGPITPQQKEIFAQSLIAQGRNDEVAVMMANPAIYADEWAQLLNRSTQPPEVDPAEQAPQPQMDPSQMGQMPMPGMNIPQPTAAVTRRCPKCQSATTSVLNDDGQMRCHRCGNIYDTDAVKEKMSRNWRIVSFQDGLNDAPNPVAAPAADATAPGDREQQQDSSLTWQATDGTPLQVGQTYEMHNPGYAIPDVVKIEAVKPDSITVTMEGEYNSPSDPQDANGPDYTHEINRQELETEGLTFNPVDSGEGEMEQSQDQNDQDGIGQTVNTEPTRQSPEFPAHASVEKAPTDHCPKCDYGHVTSSYESAEVVRYECYRCAHAWQITEDNEGVDAGLESRAWLNESSIQDDIGFDPRVLAMASAGQGRNIKDIAKRDPRLKEIHNRLEANKTAGAKFSPSKQREFIEEDGVARNTDRLDLDGTHYESAFDNSKAHPDRVNDNYLGLGL